MPKPCENTSHKPSILSNLEEENKISEEIMSKSHQLRFRLNDNALV